MKLDQFQLHADIEEKHWWFLGRRRIMRELIRSVAPPSSTTTIVDVGCGTGGNIAALAADYPCIGLDASEEAVRFARGRFPAVRFVCASAPDGLGDLARQGRCFLLMDILEHLPDDRRFLARFTDLVQPGALFLITVPADMSLWSKHDVSFGHYRRYDMNALQRLFSGLPVRTRLLSYFNTYLYSIAKVMRAASRLSGRCWGCAGTDLWMPGRALNGVLERILASEARVLVDALNGRRPKGFSFGLSLIALLRREP